MPSSEKSGYSAGQFLRSVGRLVWISCPPTHVRRGAPGRTFQDRGNTYRNPARKHKWKT